MIKKIKDLTREEFEKICGKNSCDYCPLDLDGTRCRYSDLEHYGDEEIEVDEDEKENQELKNTYVTLDVRDYCNELFDLQDENQALKGNLKILEENKETLLKLFDKAMGENTKLKKVIKILKGFHFQLNQTRHNST